MSSSTVTGIVEVIEDTKTYGQKGFRKRIVVLKQDGGRFTNYLPMEFIQDGCDSVDELKVGQNIEVTYRLSGRKWQRDEQSEVKYFLSAEAMNFRVIDGDGGADAGPQPGDTFTSSGNPDEEVPF